MKEWEDDSAPGAHWRIKLQLTSAQLTISCFNPFVSHRVRACTLVHALHSKHSRRVSILYISLAHALTNLAFFLPSTVTSATSSSLSSVNKAVACTPRYLNMLTRNIKYFTRFSRGFATHASNISRFSAPPAVLHLKTGQSFAGRSFGAHKSIYGETVFSTSITSCKLSFIHCF